MATAAGGAAFTPAPSTGVDAASAPGTGVAAAAQTPSGARRPAAGGIEAGSAATKGAASLAPAGRASESRANQSPPDSGGSGGGAPAGAVPNRIGTLSPIVIGSVGPQSGPLGDQLRPMVEAARVWAKSITRKGGLNGHPVNFIVYDSGGDPARHRAAVQQAV